MKNAPSNSTQGVGHVEGDALAGLPGQTRVKKHIGIDVLKAFAALLIINSHLEQFYPRSFLAADGMLGHTIFFFTHGYTLAGSMERRPGQGLLAFLWNRLIRLYPALWVVVALLPAHSIDWGGLKGWVDALLYPTHYTFIHIVVPAYPLFYLVRHVSGTGNVIGCLGVALVMLAFAFAVHAELAVLSVGVAWSTFGGVTWGLHLFGAMLLGAWKAGKDEMTSSSSPSRPLVLLIILWICYVTLRLLALPAISVLGGGWTDGLSVGAMPVCVGVCFLSLCTLERFRNAALLRAPLPSSIIAFLSNHSWETYLIHNGVACLALVGSFIFPWNVMAVFAITLLAAPLLHYVVDPKRIRF